MFVKIRCWAAAGSLAFLASHSLAQGPLSPPGPPGPTMRTLDQLHDAAIDAKMPGVAINAANTPGDQTAMFVITSPGRYYLPAPIAVEAGKAGIRLEADDVHLDLNGMTISGIPAQSLDGITSGNDGGDSVTVRNGIIRGFDNSGVTLGLDASVAELRVYSCGSFGIAAQARAKVRDCHVQSCGYGIQASTGSLILRCSVSTIGSTAISLSTGYTQVRECTLESATNGIQQSNGGYCIIADNIIRNMSGKGLDLCAYNKVEDNFISGCAVAGIDLRCGGNVATRNTLIGNQLAIDTSANNEEQVFANTLRANTANFSVMTGNYIAPVGNAASATNPFTNLDSP